MRLPRRERPHVDARRSRSRSCGCGRRATRRPCAAASDRRADSRSRAPGDRGAGGAASRRRRSTCRRRRCPVKPTTGARVGAPLAGQRLAQRSDRRTALGAVLFEPADQSRDGARRVRREARALGVRIDRRTARGTPCRINRIMPSRPSWRPSSGLKMRATPSACSAAISSGDDRRRRRRRTRECDRIRPRAAGRPGSRSTPCGRPGRTRRDRVRVLLHRGVDDLVHAAVVPEVDHLGALRLEDAAHDVDRGVVAVEERGRRDDAHGAGAALGEAAERWSRRTPPLRAQRARSARRAGAILLDLVAQRRQLADARVEIGEALREHAGRGARASRAVEPPSAWTSFSSRISASGRPSSCSRWMKRSRSSSSGP